MRLPPHTVQAGILFIFAALAPMSQYLERCLDGVVTDLRAELGGQSA